MSDEKKQSGGVDIKGDEVNIKGDVVGRDKNIVFTLGGGAAAVLVLGLLTFFLLPRFLPSPQPTATPLAFAAARDDETLLIIADFDDRSAGGFSGATPNQRIYSAITQKLPNYKINARIGQYHEPIKDSAEARRVLETYKAIILIWGWYDKLGIETGVEIDSKKVAANLPKLSELSLDSPESARVRFAKDIPAQVNYIAFVVLGVTQQKGDADSAASLFTEAIRSAEAVGQDVVRPDFAYINRGNIYSAQHKYDLAIGDYSKAIELDPKNKESYLNRGVVYYDQQKYDLAISDYVKAIELDSKYAFAYNNRGYAYYSQQKYDQALTDYNKAIDLDPKNKVAYNNRGLVYEAQQKYDMALADYTKAIELDPKFALAYKNRAFVNSIQQKYDPALVDYTKAIEVDPKDADAYNNRGYIYFQQKKYDLALSDLNKTIEIDPRVAEFYSSRGDVYSAQKQYDLALVDYRKAIALDPNTVSAYCGLGITFARMNDFSSAITNLEKSVGLDKGSNYPRCKTALDNARKGTPTP